MRKRLAAKLHRGKKLLAQKRGLSLVEFAVAFALTGIFLLMSGQLFANAMGTYQNVRAAAQGAKVADVLTNELKFAIQRADCVNGKGLEISKDGQSVTFYDNAGRRISYAVANGQLVKTVKEGGESETSYPLDEEWYAGFAIKSLTFAQADGQQAVSYPDNVLFLELRLSNGRNADAVCRKWIECYRYPRGKGWIVQQ